MTQSRTTSDYHIYKCEHCGKPIGVQIETQTHVDAIQPAEPVEDETDYETDTNTCRCIGTVDPDTGICQLCHKMKR